MDGELKVNLLPTPRVSDSKGVDNETEWVRHSPGLAAMSFHLRSDDDPARKKNEKLFGTPQARDWKGVPGDTYNSHNLARDVSDLVVEEPNLLMPTTPLAQHGGSAPEEHLRCKPGRTRVAGPVTLAENNNLPETGGELSDLMFPTPRATRGGSATETLNLIQSVQEQTENFPMVPTPKAHDGVFGRPRTSGRPIEKSTHLQTIVTLLPTPTAGDGMGGSARTVSDGNGGRRPIDWEDTTKPTGSGGASRLRDVVGLIVPPPIERETEDLSLSPTPRAQEPGRTNPGYGEGLREVVGRLLPQLDSTPLLPTPTVGAREVRNSPGEMARNSPALGAVIADLAEHGDRSQFSNNLPVLPTPVTQDGNGHMQDMSADVGNNGRSVSLGDVVSRLPDGEGPVMLLPTPVATDSSGTRNSTAWRSNPDSTAKIGDTLTDVMWKLAAERGEMELPTGSSQARFAESPELMLFPTPCASDGNGGKSPKDLSATTRQSGARRQVCLPEAVKMVRFDDHRHHHGDNP